MFILIALDDASASASLMPSIRWRGIFDGLSYLSRGAKASFSQNETTVTVEVYQELHSRSTGIRLGLEFYNIFSCYLSQSLTATDQRSFGIYLRPIPIIIPFRIGFEFKSLSDLLNLPELTGSIF